MKTWKGVELKEQESSIKEEDNKFKIKYEANHYGKYDGIKFEEEMLKESKEVIIAFSNGFNLQFDIDDTEIEEIKNHYKVGKIFNLGELGFPIADKKAKVTNIKIK